MDRSRVNFVQTDRLSVAQPLHAFIEQEALPGTGISAAAFWGGLADLVRDLGECNRQLLEVRKALQSRIDAYHRDRVGQPLDLSQYESFLREIGYLLPPIEDFNIHTTNVDDEIARIAGPQLVVPLSNARYSLNAANARWGSLYDALYGSDAISEEGGAARAAHTTPFAVSASWRAGARYSMRPSRSLKVVTAMLAPTWSKAVLWLYDWETAPLPVLLGRRNSPAIAANSQHPQRCCSATTIFTSRSGSIAPVWRDATIRLGSLISCSKRR
jgi:malate synthase